MREGFLQLANAEPERWVVVENVGVTEKEIAEHVWQVVAARLADRGMIPTGTTADEPTPPARYVPEIDTDNMELPRDAASLVEQFFSILEEYVQVDSRISAYHINGLDMQQADELRMRLKDIQPQIIAYGLEGVNSDVAWRLRRELMDIEPGYVARSLAGFPLEGDALGIREQLKNSAPSEVARSLKGMADEASMLMREELFDSAPDGVLLSLKGIDTDPAWKLRDRCGRKLHREALAESLSRIDSPRAWEIRNRLLAKYAAWVLRGLGPLGSDNAWQLREQFLGLAPKLVARTLNGLDTDRAYDMRERIGNAAKEVLDSLHRLESDRAWSIREKLKDIFPSTAVSSLGKFNDSEKAWNFRHNMIVSHPGNLLLLKHVVESLSLTGKL
jgi:dTMP kinase